MLDGEPARQDHRGDRVQALDGQQQCQEGQPDRKPQGGPPRKPPMKLREQSDREADDTEDQDVGHRDHPDEVPVRPQPVDRDVRIDGPLRQDQPKLEPAGRSPNHSVVRNSPLAPGCFPAPTCSAAAGWKSFPTIGMIWPLCLTRTDEGAVSPRRRRFIPPR